MPALLMLVGSLGLNYARHRRGLSTICSTCRRHVGPFTFLVGWVGLTAWIAPHYCRPFFRAVTTAVAEVLDDMHDVFDTEE